MGNNCNLIKDLLPLYADEVCSDESHRIVAEHISGCTACRGMLEKMNQQLVVNVNNDICTFKRIKRRIWIERIVIALLVTLTLMIGGWFVCFFLLNTDRTVDFEQYNLADNLYAEEDDAGNVWLVKQGQATEAWQMMVNPRDVQGEYMLTEQMLANENYNREEVNGWGITLKERKIDALYSVRLVAEHYNEWDRERTMILDATRENHRKINEIYYYDDVTDTEYLLWRRGE